MKLLSRQVLFVKALLLLAMVGLAGCRDRKSSDGSQQDSASQQTRNGPGNSVDSQPVEAIQLFDVSDKSGIQFVHQDGSFGKFLLPETMSGGLALFDYDGDSLIDIYFCNGTPLDPNLKVNGANASTPSRKGNALYKNLGGLRFRDVTLESGLESSEFGLGVTVGDYDNDGFADIYASNFGRNALYHNNGDGCFVKVSMQIDGGVDEDRFAAGASFADFDGDGDLDLFVGSYVRLTPSDIQQQVQLSRTQYPGPHDFEPALSLLLSNAGDGTWVDRSVESNIASFPGTGMGCVTGDFDEDGDVDIYVANDEMPNHCFANDGSGVFEESAFSLGVAVDSVGVASGSMGVDAGDLNNDGRFDLILTTFEYESITLYQKTENMIFQDVTRDTHVGDGTKPHVTWGCCIADFENDGDRDIYIASGHLDQRSENSFYRVSDLLIKNLLRERDRFEFRNVTASSGNLSSVRQCSRGAAAADLDNDGDVDMVVLNVRDKPSVLENRSTETNNRSLQLHLVGTRSNRDAVGTRVRVSFGDRQLSDEVRNGRGYQSYWGSRLHFGLGMEKQIDRIEINWFNGQTQVIEGIPANQTLTIVQPD